MRRAASATQISVNLAHCLQDGGTGSPRPAATGPGAAALRATVLGGDVEAGEEQLAFLGARGVEVGRARFEVRRQAFYELLDRARGRPPPAQELLEAVQALEGQSSRDEFSELCYLMTLPSLQDSPDFADWTVEGGRAVAVARLDRLLGGAGAGDAGSAAAGAGDGSLEGGAGRLEVLLRQAVSWQQAEAARRGVAAECHSLLSDPWDAPPPPRPAAPGGLLPLHAWVSEGAPPELSLDTPRDEAWEPGTRAAPSAPSSPAAGVPLPAAQPGEPGSSSKGSEGGEAPGEEASGDARLGSPSGGEEEAPRERGGGGSCGAAEISPELPLPPTYSGPYEGWEAPLGFTPRTVLSETHPVRALEFSPSGHELAVGCNSARALRIFSLEGSRASAGVKEVAAIEEHHLGSIYCLDWDPSGEHIASGSNDCEVRVVSRAARGFGEACGVMRGHDGPVRTVRFAPADAALLASAGDGDGRVRLWDVPSETCVQEVPCGAGPITALEFLPGSDSVLLAACARGVLSVDRRSGAASELFSAPSLRPGSRARLTHLATSGHSALACLSFSDGALLWVDPARPGAAATTTAYPHAGECRSVAFSPCGRWTLSAGFDAMLFLSDSATGETLARCRGHQDRAVAARFHPGAVGLASCGCDGALKLWPPLQAGASRGPPAPF